MTVAELIAELQKLDPTLQVVNEYDSLYTEPEVIVVTENSVYAPYTKLDWNGKPNPTPPFVMVQ
jgi:hypothetical protein